MVGHRVVEGRRRQAQGGLLKLALAGVLGFAALVHGIVTPDHLAESPLVGLGFLAAGGSQLGFASLVLVRPSRVMYIALISVTTILIGLYVANVVIGLPLHAAATRPEAALIADHGYGTRPGQDHGHAAITGHADGHPLDAATHLTPEPVDALGLATQVAQLAAIVLALTLLRRSASLPSSPPPA